jgi:arylsulfatase A-like enzyme
MHATDDRLAKFPNESDKRRRTYDAMMLALDEAIGKVRAKLTETGQDRDTLVFFISDNGGPTMVGTTINGSRNTPFRGSKRTTLEGGIHVPYLVAWPSHIKPGVFASPAIQLDLHATALAAAGVAPKPEWKLEGVNLLPFLSGEKSGAPHDALYWRMGDQMAIRRGDWKLVRYDTNADTNQGGRPPATGPKLYNVVTDVHEDHDVAATNPEKVKELQALWDAWDKSNVKPLWGAGSVDNDGPEPGATSTKNKRKNKTDE